MRVRSPREEIERATALAIAKKEEGYSPEALVLAVDEVLHNVVLSRAVVLYAQNAESRNLPAIERPVSWFSVLMASGFAVFCIWLVVVLFRLVDSETGFLAAFGIVILQSILLSLTQRGVRLAFMAAADGLNNASYPTNLHPLRNANSAVGSLRLRRLRGLVLDSANRIKEGEQPEDIARDLAEVNLTPGASRFIVRLARVNLAVRDYLPPYENRWLAYTLAFAFLITCIAVMNRAKEQPEGLENYAAAVAGMIAVKLTASPRRPGFPPE